MRVWHTRSIWVSSLGGQREPGASLDGFGFHGHDQRRHAWLETIISEVRKRHCAWGTDRGSQPAAGWDLGGEKQKMRVQSCVTQGEEDLNSYMWGLSGMVKQLFEEASLTYTGLDI